MSKPKPFKFVQFGCWNQGECEIIETPNPSSNQIPNPISNVMAKLRNYSNTLSELHLDLIIIAGDNYYPNKEKTGKGKTKNTKGGKSQTRPK